MPSLRVVSLNLWNGGRLFEAARDFLLEQQADIYFLQEAYDGRGIDSDPRFRTVELLEQAFPEYDAYFGPVYLDPRKNEGKIEDGNLLLSKWPLQQRLNYFVDIPYQELDQDTTTDFSLFPVTIQKAQVDIEGTLLTLLNVHGPVNHNGTEDDQRRLAFRDAILTLSDERTIVAGDFNVRPQTQTIAGLEKKFTTVFGQELETTFNTRRKDLTKFPGYADSAVDMMFVSPTIKVVEHSCPQVDVSDHLPLTATLLY